MSSPHFSSRIVERAKCEHAWKSPHVWKARRGREREKWGTTDKAQAFDPSWSTDFGVWSSYPLSNQLSTSNGIPSVIELSLLLSSVTCGGYLLQVWENQILIFFAAVSREELDSVKSQNAACSNEFLFLWQVHYALKENVLTEQMRFLPLITYSEVVKHIIIFCDYCLWLAWFALWCKSILFDLFWKVNVAKWGF